MAGIQDDIDFSKGSHGLDVEALSVELCQMRARGDAHSLLDKFRLWLAIRAADRAALIAASFTDKGIALRQTIATERSATYAACAVAISILALLVSCLTYIKPP